MSLSTSVWSPHTLSSLTKGSSLVDMEDEDDTCLLDVLCDPQALNEFLHGTNELSSGDLLLMSSSGDPALFTDTPSPESLLDDASSLDTPISASVDLSFLDEALLASPASGFPEEAQEDPNESEEICDILQQSLHEADITEDTLALEARLAQTAQAFQTGSSDASLPLPATPYFSKPLSIPSMCPVPKDIQIAVEPPQPSLLAVGPGCPSLKTPGTQFMSLLPGNVFPCTHLEMSIPINSQTTSMIIQSPASHQTSASIVRTIVPTGAALQKNPLPIQPKLPVNIQPRLLQIGPSPKPLSGIAFISANATHSVMFSPSVQGSKQALQAPATLGLSKPMSFNLVGQGGPMVIKPQEQLPGPTPLLLPRQTAINTLTSIPRCVNTPSNPTSNKPNVESSHVMAVRPKQINLSPIFTRPAAQLALKQGAVLTGSLQIQSTPSTVLQMPGTCAPRVHGRNEAAAGNQITLVNNASMLLPDIPIVNDESVVEPEPNHPVQVEPQGKNSVLLLPERRMKLGEKVQKPPEESRLLPHASTEPMVQIHLQPSPVTTLLKSPPDIRCTPEPVSLSTQLMTQAEEERLDQALHLPEQHPQKPSPTTLPRQMDKHMSAGIEDMKAFETLSSLCESEEIAMPTYSGSEHRDILLQPTIGQCSTGTEESCSSEGSDAEPMSMAPGAESSGQDGPVKIESPSSSELFMHPQQLHQTHGLTSTAQEQQYGAYDMEPMVPYASSNSGTSSMDLQDLEELMHLRPSLNDQNEETYSTFQKKVQSACVELTPAEKQQRVKHQLFLDHNAILSPNTSAPFESLEDAVRQLLPYHTCARDLPNQAHLNSVDKQFECFSVILSKRIKDMLNKYRQLLLTESQQENPSAEMVMLERLFLQSERLSLREDRCRTRTDPESAKTKLKNSSLHSQASLRTDFSRGPSSPPTWALQSDRPPGLKTYRSSSKGTLRLTIKHELGFRKLIQNPPNAISGHKRNYSGQLTKGGAVHANDESLKPALLKNNDEDLNKLKLHLDVEMVRTSDESQKLSGSLARPGYVAPRVEGSFPEQCTPELKRTRQGSSDSPSLPLLVEDGELSEHLQSAIDSILELQRLQGSAGAVKPKIQQPRALDQAVSSR